MALSNTPSQEYSWQGTNLPLFGSDEDKRVKSKLFVCFFFQKYILLWKISYMILHVYQIFLIKKEKRRNVSL